MLLSGKAMLLASALGVIVALAGCGSSGGRLLSRPAATQLSAELTQASTALANYDCPAADTAIAEFHNDVGQLQGVNSTLVTMLSQGASTISALAKQRCPQTATATIATRTATTRTTRPTRTSPSTTTTTAPATTTGQSPATVATTSTGSGGAAPTTTSTPASASTPTTVTQAPPPSGGAGLSGGSAASGSGG